MDVEERIIQLEKEISSLRKELGKEKVWIDPATHLMWQLTEQEMTWEQAIEYAKNLTYASYSDWRMPTIEELSNIIDYTCYDPACSKMTIKSDYYWASTSYAFDSEKAWRVYFYYGYVSYGYKTSSYYARYVRDVN